MNDSRMRRNKTVTTPSTRIQGVATAKARRAGLAAAITLGLALGGVSCSGAAEGPRGVLLISVDSLRADHLSAYGYSNPRRPDRRTSPYLDRMLADQGVLFERNYSSTSWTLPAHMSLLTGLPNELHGVRGLPDRLHENHRLLAQVYRDAGWRTGGFWSGPNLHPFFGFDRGFERYVDCSSVEVTSEKLFKPKTEESWLETVELHDRSHEGVTGPALVKAFGEWVDELGEEERFFGFVHMWDVHYDFQPPAEFDVFSNPSYRGQARSSHYRDLDLEPPLDQEDAIDVAALRDLYDGEILHNDHNLGQILEKLDARGWLDDTLIVFTADHGDEFFEHDGKGHKNHLFEEVVRVPLVMRWDGELPAGKRIAESVSLMDVAPTLLDLCNLAAPKGVWGRSLRPLIEGASLPERAIPMELSYRPSVEIMRAWVRGDQKVMDIPRKEKLFIFDLEKDPYEKTPELLLRDSKDARIRAALEFWSELDAQAARGAASVAGEMPGELMDELNKHGYLGEDNEAPGFKELPEVGD